MFFEISFFLCYFAAARILKKRYLEYQTADPNALKKKKTKKPKLTKEETEREGAKERKERKDNPNSFQKTPSVNTDKPGYTKYILVKILKTKNYYFQFIHPSPNVYSNL